MGRLVVKGFLGRVDHMHMNKFAIIILCLFSLAACNEKGADPTVFLGTWRLQSQDGRHTIMSVRNNGTLEIDIRTEGQLSKIVDKSGKATGTWELDESEPRITLDITAGAAAIGWPEGPSIFQIRQVDEKSLVLATPDNREYRWEKSSHRTADPVAEETGLRLTLAPLVVNLTPGTTQASRRYKWLCVALEVQLAPGSRETEVRSQWQDKVLLLLSSKTYEEVNTLDKLNHVGKELQALLAPYMGGDIEKVVFTRTIVTGNQEAVDNFCSQSE